MKHRGGEELFIHCLSRRLPFQKSLCLLFLRKLGQKTTLFYVKDRGKTVKPFKKYMNLITKFSILKKLFICKFLMGSLIFI